MYTAHYRSPIGPLTLASDGHSITGLWLDGQKYFGASLPAEAKVCENLPALTLAKDWLQRYFAGQRPDPGELPLAPAGSPFRQSVWNLLREIPYGQVTTYGSIATELARRTEGASVSAQAVGGAVGHNPISIFIPCHRVVGANGSLTGYAGGVDKKWRLLELEQADLSRLFLPKRGTAL